MQEDKSQDSVHVWTKILSADLCNSVLAESLKSF